MNYNCLVTFPLGEEILFHVNIKEIHLKGNLFKHFKFPLTIFLTTKHISLNFLDLSYNNLTIFENHGLPVSKLVVTHNRLINFEYILFSADYVSVEAQYNNISKVASNVNYNALNLSHNSLQSFHDIKIASSPVTGVLDLSYNNLILKNRTIISSDYYDEEDDDYLDYRMDIFRPNFNEQFAVNHLDISYNNIDTFTYLKDLERYKYTKNLNLRGNQIKNLNLSVVKKTLSSLKSLNIKENPITNHQVEGIWEGLNLYVDESIVFPNATETPEQTLISTTSTTSTTPKISSTSENISTSTSKSEDNFEITTQEFKKNQTTESTETSQKSTTQPTKSTNTVAIGVSIFLAILMIAAIFYFVYYKTNCGGLRYRRQRENFNEAENML